MDHAALKDRLSSIGQGNVLRFYDGLDEAGKASSTGSWRRWISRGCRT